jgi:hypothetical protein
MVHIHLITRDTRAGIRTENLLKTNHLPETSRYLYRPSHVITASTYLHEFNDGVNTARYVTVNGGLQEISRKKWPWLNLRCHPYIFPEGQSKNFRNVTQEFRLHGWFKLAPTQVQGRNATEKLGSMEAGALYSLALCKQPTCTAWPYAISPLVQLGLTQAAHLYSLALNKQHICTVWPYASSTLLQLGLKQTAHLYSLALCNQPTCSARRYESRYSSAPCKPVSIFKWLRLTVWADAPLCGAASIWGSIKSKSDFCGQHELCTTVYHKHKGQTLCAFASVTLTASLRASPTFNLLKFPLPQCNIYTPPLRTSRLFFWPLCFINMLVFRALSLLLPSLFFLFFLLHFLELGSSVNIVLKLWIKPTANWDVVLR